eukprot:CAMPEP_0206146888 /NCGR_PEP_ID=MMETSP1473-20131121/31713_1 /ASSEMBLY_ACC=CAM_ASM_001109 /TAXON_ID=1461547 /ORGANISM="Stichococcus sp, Strain RCC1054" /LENGTH=351 /DNA_ID=CAMNT_0053543609 /DNA_START=378 /DNA_END=1433 /DNA_ORIENTATION=-
MGLASNPTAWRVLLALLAAAALLFVGYKCNGFSGVRAVAGRPYGAYRRPRAPPAPLAPPANINDLQINAPLGTDLKLTGRRLDRLVVFARHREDITFLNDMREIPYLVYQDKNDSAWLQTPPGVGDETRAYLKFIVDNYDRLPDRVVFAHAHRTAWHHVIDAVGQLKLLRWSGAPPFANLRGSDVNLWQSNLWPNKLSNCNDKDAVESSQALRRLWKDAVAKHINGTAGANPPDLISAPCCGEFEVTAVRMMARPLQLYKDMLEWTTIEDVQEDAYHRGRAFEYVWHMVFGEPAVIKPVHECALYMCDGYRKLPRVPETGAFEIAFKANKTRNAKKTKAKKASAKGTQSAN